MEVDHFFFGGQTCSTKRRVCSTVQWLFWMIISLFLLQKRNFRLLGYIIIVFFFCSDHQSARAQLETWGPDEAESPVGSCWAILRIFVLRSVWRVPSFRSAKFVGGPFGTKEMEVLASNGRKVADMVKMGWILLLGVQQTKVTTWESEVSKWIWRLFISFWENIMKLRLQTFLDSISWSTMRTFILFLGGGSFFCSNKQTSWVSFSTAPPEKKHIQKRCWKSIPFAWLLMKVELFEPLPGQQVENVPKASKVAMCQLLRFPTKTWPALLRDHGNWQGLMKASMSWGGGIGRGRSIIPGGSTVRESPLNRKGFHGFRYFRLSTSSDFFPFDYILRNQTRLVQSIYRGAGGAKCCWIILSTDFLPTA